jgi:hypothetical protein
VNVGPVVVPDLDLIPRGSRVLLPGGQVMIPDSPSNTRYNLYTFNTPVGGRTSILYDTWTGNAVAYDLSTSVGNEYRLKSLGPESPGLAITTLPGSGSFSAGTANPSLGLGTFNSGLAGSLPGLPAINPVTPSYDYQLNAPPAAPPISPP